MTRTQAATATVPRKWTDIPDTRGYFRVLAEGRGFVPDLFPNAEHAVYGVDQTENPPVQIRPRPTDHGR